MPKLEESPLFGMLQEFVDSLYSAPDQAISRIEVVVAAESFGLNDDLLEIVNLLPPGTYERARLCGQFNSSISSHGWGYYYGTVE